MMIQPLLITKYVNSKEVQFKHPDLETLAGGTLSEGSFGDASTRTARIYFRKVGKFVSCVYSIDDEYYKSFKQDSQECVNQTIAEVGQFVLDNKIEFMYECFPLEQSFDWCSLDCVLVKYENGSWGHES